MQKQLHIWYDATDQMFRAVPHALLIGWTPSYHKIDSPLDDFDIPFIHYVHIRQ